MSVTNKSVRILKHPSGIFEVQYCIKSLWGLLECWYEDGLFDDLTLATERANSLYLSEREEKTKVVYLLN